MSAAHEFIRYSLRIGALELIPEGRRLSSGRISPYFFNSALFSSGEASNVLARGYAEKIVSLRPMPTVLFGPAYKGISLSVSTAMELQRSYHINLGWSFNRKEAKGHGEGGIICGESLRGRSVVVLDDVITTGSSVLKAIEIINAEGGSVKACVISLDRRERTGDDPSSLSAVQQLEQEIGIPVIAAATVDDLIEVLQSDDPVVRNASEMLLLIRQYQERYGVAA